MSAQEMFKLYRDCTPTGPYGVAVSGDYVTGTLVGVYPTEDAAMCAAQDLGLLRPAGEDEGGPQFSCLSPPNVIIKVAN